MDKINDNVQEENEAAFRELAEKCEGDYGSMAQAVSELGIPRVKAVRPTHLYRGTLTLGDPEKYESAMTINVERYPRTMVARPPTASQFVVRQQDSLVSAESSATMQNGDSREGADQDDLAAVKNQRKYQVNDPEAPDGKRDVEMEDLAKGYSYGSTAVHISESDKNVVKLESEKGLEIMGFIPSDNVSH